MTQNIYLKDTKSDLFNHEYNLHACSEPQLSLTVCGMSSGGFADCVRIHRGEASAF
jgi:hypothetical protein